MPSVNDRLRPLIDPTSIAVLGASANLSRLGGMPIALLLERGFAGSIYPINPKYEEVGGLKCYPSIEALPGPVDLLVIAVGASDVLGALREAAAKGIRAAVVFAAGFAETGEADDIELQRQIAEFANEHQIAVAGPNCMGLGNLDSHAYSTFTAIFRTKEPPVAPRDVALVAQSGSVCSAVYAEGRNLDVRFNVFATTGNEACVEFAEYLDYLADRPGTEAIVGYVEGLRDGERFRRVASRMRDDGRLLALLKAGHTSKGAEAVAAHTAAVAGNPAVYRAVFDRLCVIQARDIPHLSDMAYMARFRGRSMGPRVAILTISGAMGALLSDAFIDAGMGVPTFSDSIQSLLHTGIPKYGMVCNPVDLTGNIVNRHEFVAEALSRLLLSDEIDFVVLYAPAFLLDRFAAGIKQVAGATNKLIALIATGSPQRRAEFHDDGVPVFEDLTRAVQALASLSHWHQNRRRYAASATGPYVDKLPEAARSLVEEACAAGCLRLDGREARHFLSASGVPVDAGESPPQDGGFAVEISLDFLSGLIMTVSVSGDTEPSSDDALYATLPLDHGEARVLVSAMIAKPDFRMNRAGETIDVDAALEILTKLSTTATGLGADFGQIRVDLLVGPSIGVVLADASVEFAENLG